MAIYREGENYAKVKNTQRRGKAFSLDSIGQIQTRPQPRTSYFDKENEQT